MFSSGNSLGGLLSVTGLAGVADPDLEQDMTSHWLFGLRACLVALVATSALPAMAAYAPPAKSEDPSASVQGAAAPEHDKAQAAFGYDTVVQLAKQRAAEPYSAPAQIPQFLRDFDFARLDQIKYKRDRALWHDSALPFEAMLYHPGSYYSHAVKIHRVTDDGVEDVAFDKSRFGYPDSELAGRVPKDLGYAGFRLLHELDTPDKLDEVISFLGASYFRALGGDAHYGLSGRGLAIDTASESGEEFPAFVEFWLVEPGADADTVTVYALLDSPSAAGAYRFDIEAGQATQTRVESTLFTRKPVAKLGVAPLTSMFTWGENSLARLDDYRPEAHDSDGLLISAMNGEWLWRPLRNPQKLSLDQFSADNVRGFGLMQRDRDFDHYQDLDYQYEKRPSAWVVPRGDWGKGHLELVQIPSDSEVNDNIALYWVPEEPVEKGERLHYAYDIKWSDQLAGPESLAHVSATRVGRAAVAPGDKRKPTRVVIEFVGDELDELTESGDVQPRVNAMRDATINNIQAVRNPHTGGWRLTFLVPTDSLKSPLELRAFLAGANGGALTETWSYALSP